MQQNFVNSFKTSKNQNFCIFLNENDNSMNPTCPHTDRQTHKQTHKQTNTQAKTQTNTQRHNQTHKQANNTHTQDTKLPRFSRQLKKTFTNFLNISSNLQKISSNFRHKLQKLSSNFYKFPVFFRTQTTQTHTHTHTHIHTNKQTRTHTRTNKQANKHMHTQTY